MASCTDSCPKHWGVTTPRSFDHPLEADLCSTKKLEKVLDGFKSSMLHTIDTVGLLSGCNVFDQIFDLVPNKENFETTVRCIKYWARTRCLRSSVPGYLGDFEWAILVARVCQAYPNAAPSTLVSKFFSIYSEWEWPNPVMLCLITKDDTRGLPVWDPNNNWDDNADLMPVIEPVYPYKNLARHVSTSTLRDIETELALGHQLCKNIVLKNADWCTLLSQFKYYEGYLRYCSVDSTPVNDWELKYFEAHGKYYHVAIMASNNVDLEIVKSWFGKDLVKVISQIEKDHKTRCQLCPIEYASSDSCEMFIGLPKGITGNVFPKDVLKGIQIRFSASGLKKPGMVISIKHVGKANLSSVVLGMSCRLAG